MRILLDNNLSPRLVAELRTHGHDVEHVRDHGLGASPDDQVLGFARDQARVLVSADTDFGPARPDRDGETLGGVDPP